MGKGVDDVMRSRFLVCLALIAVATAVVTPLTADESKQIDFVEHVQPILREHCFECHAGEVEEGDLNLATKAHALKGGESGAVIVPGDGAASQLVKLVSGVDEDRIMPPEGNSRLSKTDIGILKSWIDQGATWPNGADVSDPRLERARKHWAFQRLRKITPPTDSGDTVSERWAETAIDLFVANKLKQNALSPSPPASARTLIRRIYFDLIGLPPNRQQVTDFIAAHSRDPQSAFSELVDTLLSSEHFGERWARHWLDVARYADSDGQESDRDRPHAWRYRDFVIESFNADMPYDQFVRWQLAGDEFQPDSDEAVSATGFLTAGTSFKLKDTFLERERLFNRYNELDDIVSTVGTGLLGITTGCARCHDHKYDAFSAREYYQLVRIFHSGDRVTDKLPSGEDGFFFQDFDAEPRTTWLFRRSDFYDREIEVKLGFPTMLSDELEAQAYWANAKASVAAPKSTLQRRAFADWVTDVNHGGGALLARVIVNRVWQQHFGHGLVRTASDFGVRGDPPTHPELLEFLAHDLVQNGWKLKRLHRMIVTSAVWRQSATVNERANKVDLQNRLLWKMPPRRLEAEALRDAMLSASDTLNLEAGGPGFKPYIQPEANLARNIQGGAYPKDAKDNQATRRRSIYMFHKRLIPYPLFQAFDRPELMSSCSRRQNTTVAPQAMAILNDRFVRAVAQDFADRLLTLSDDNNITLINQAFEISFARPPSKSEIATAEQFIKSQFAARTARNEENARREAVADFCHTLFGLNEFIYVD